MDKKIYLVIPTYNESANIKDLINKISDLKIFGVNILVVDDNSHDGTGQIVEDLRREREDIEIMHRQSKQGLGAAYVAGFKQALSKGADYIMQMDADFSHDPKYLPVLLDKIENCDLVLGSRYVKGGGVKNWNLIRRVISRLGNIYAAAVLGLKIKDLTGGFKCYRSNVLREIDLNNLSSVGYNFQIETTYLASKKGFKICEVPIIFTERTQGKSKFNFKIINEKCKMNF